MHQRITDDPTATINLGFARLDTARAARQGVPEAILAEGKSPDQVASIVTALLERGDETILVTRAGPEVRAAVRAAVGDIEEDVSCAALFHFAIDGAGDDIARGERFEQVVLIHELDAFERFENAAFAAHSFADEK